MCIDVHSMSFKINETIQRDTKSKYSWLFVVQLRGLFSNFRPCTKSWSSCDCSATRTDSSTLPRLRMSQRYQTLYVNYKTLPDFHSLSRCFHVHKQVWLSRLQQGALSSCSGTCHIVSHTCMALSWLPRTLHRFDDGMQHLQATCTKALAWAAKPFAICLGAVEDQMQNW